MEELGGLVSIFNKSLVHLFFWLQKKVYRNLPYNEIHEHEVANKEGEMTANETCCVETGKYT